MDIKQLKFSMKLAETRAKSDPSEANIAILKAATDAYEFAIDPEKKTEDEADHKPAPVAPKPAAPKAASQKPAAQKPAAAPKVEPAPTATPPSPTEPSTPQSQEEQPLTATTVVSDPA